MEERGRIPAAYRKVLPANGRVFFRATAGKDSARERRTGEVTVV